MLSKYVRYGFALCCWLLAAISVEAMEIASPTQVLLSPQQAKLLVRQVCTVRTVEGVSSFVLYLPAEAKDFHFSIEDQSVIGWKTHFETVDNDNTPYTGSLARKKTTLQQHLAELKARQQALAAEENLWLRTAPKSVSVKELRSFTTQLQETILRTQEESHRLTQRILACEQELKELGPLPTRVQVVTVQLAKQTAKTVSVQYSYTLANCGWHALYRFEACPDEDAAKVRLHAKIWQQSGLDWSNADIILVAKGTSWKAPRPESSWIVNDEEVLNEGASAPLPAARASQRKFGASEDVPAIPDMEDHTAGMRWSLPQKGLLEGSCIKLLREATWKAPLEWLARPRSNGGQVWLTMRCEVPDLQTWPAGQATFFIDGTAAGQSNFIPKGRRADLYFGIDPRVTVQIQEDAPRKGSEGLLIKRGIASWTWNYTLINGRSQPVNMLLEAPAVQVGTMKGTVDYNCTPQPDKGEDHILRWRVNVPPHESASVRYAVTVKP